ncbi:MAG TPA: arginine--tRNA ligase [Saprospirales bacterium]|nr:arginine--tRNA ligase [Saprospirales bacterium]
MSKHIKEQIKKTVAKIISSKYEIEVAGSEILLNLTKKEFEGNYTVVIFPFVKRLKMTPADLGAELGQAIVDEMDEISAFNVVAGFVNLSIADEQWKLTLGAYAIDETLTSLPANGKKVMVEFSSPNTNKPLHLGHIRNILLGWSSSQILKAAGYEVINTQIINDRGIAVCKSMLAWQRYGEGATPESSGIKGDHFVGQYYVRFDKELKAEYATWQTTEDAATVLADKAKEGQSADDFYSKYKNDYFNEYSVLGRDAKEMLRQWEGGDADTVALWKQMNDWVYDGFESTYKALGVSFNKLYYESDTYLLGKEVVEKGLESGVFFKKDDGSAWVDLEAQKMDEKIVLRSDGTAVYMTQDIGTAMQRYADFGIDKMVYVVGDEQNYHFKVLFTILGMLGEPYADNLHHLSYGMVDLPEGRMKSREGTVVDADDLVQEVIAEAKKANDERGEIDELSAEEQADTLRKIGMSALKYFIIKVNPQKRMTFNPAESVDMQGQTGPYIQNAYVRIQSILRKSADYTESDYSTYNTLEPMEKSLMRSLGEFKDILAVAAENLDPSMIANYAYDLGKDYHKFYHDVRILKAESEAAKRFRLQLSRTVALVLRDAMEMLGIEMPERM